MAVSINVLDFDGAQLVLPRDGKAEMTVEINGGNPYVLGGFEFTVAATQAALDTFTGHSGSPEIVSVDEAVASSPSKDGAYQAVWTGTHGEIHLTSTGVEAGAIDLSAATKRPRLRLRVTLKY
jgi:hypothetical protein